MSEPTSGYMRWAALMDRVARDEATTLTPDELGFCERFARDNSTCQRELDAYAQLADLETQPDPDTRDLVDRALARLEAEDAEQAVAEVRSLRSSQKPYWLWGSAAAAILLGIGFANRSAFFGRELTMSMDAEARARTEAGTARPLTRAELVYASGDVRVAGRPAMAGRVLLSEGTRIETGEGVACVLVDLDINLCLAAHSDMLLSALNTPTRRVDLGSGTLATRLSTQPEGYQLTIAAGDVTSTAVGTAFSVERTGGKSEQNGQPVVTTVLNGKVRVARGSTQRVVNAHERARADAGEVVVNSLSRTEEASSWALLGPTALWHDPVSATLELTGEPAGAEAFLDGQLIGRAPLSSLVPVGGHRLIVRYAGTVLLDRELYWNAGESSVVTFQNVPARAPAVVPSPETAARRKSAVSATKSAASTTRKTVQRHSADAAKVAAPSPAESAEQVASLPQLSASGPSPAELLRSARRLVREGQVRAAADTYENLRRLYPESAEAHTVLVSLGQLQLSALHDPASALQVLDAYLERGGTLSEEARLTRIYALRGLRRDRDEAAAITEFLSKHPRSFESERLRARLASIRTER